MRLTTVLTAAVGCHPDARQGCASGEHGSIDGAGAAVVAAVAVRGVRPSGAAL